MNVAEIQLGQQKYIVILVWKYNRNNSQIINDDICSLFLVYYLSLWFSFSVTSISISSAEAWNSFYIMNHC
jgi:hypothetical protein